MSAQSHQSPYRVLARKYRPKTFADLIGQDTMVRTLTNAFATGRIAQGYMLTGVRGVGKTTTARLIARALNYPPGPTVDMPELTEQCEAILESRHIDVIEMDAASNTGVDNMREIIESVRYAPVQARIKVYIIDEVHMLSKSAFNALLKTLEEPPPHVKFIFATTEIRKVPVTILSRCQRFDLKRLDAALLAQHYRRIADQEAVEAEEEALQLIARAAEGSVRDGLSLLDQAIAFGEGKVNTGDVLGMLGIVDRSRIIDLFEAVMTGDPARALQHMAEQFQSGGDPQTILADLADFTHWVTRLKVVPDAAMQDNSRTGLEKTRGRDFAKTISMPHLARAWQMLLKGLGETAMAARPEQAADMVLIRLAHAASLPAGDDLAKLVAGLQPQAPSAASAAPPSATSAPAARFERPRPDTHGIAPVMSAAAMLARKPAEQTTDSPDQPGQVAVEAVVLQGFDDVVALAARKRDIKLKTELERHVRPISCVPGKLEMALEPGAPPGLPGELSRKLEIWSGRRWIVTVARAGGEMTLAARRKADADTALKQARALPEVQAYLKAFPGAEVLRVREPEVPQLPDMTTEEGDEESR